MRAGVSIGTVRAIEQTRTVDPSFFTILDLLDVLGVDVTEAAELARAEGDAEDRVPKVDGELAVGGATPVEEASRQLPEGSHGRGP